jgi:hypothetical protein
MAVALTFPSGWIKIIGFQTCVFGAKDLFCVKNLMFKLAELHVMKFVYQISCIKPATCPYVLRSNQVGEKNLRVCGI